MNRRLALTMAFCVVGLANTGEVQAQSRTCPADESKFVMYPINGTLGDAVPDPSEEPLWDRLVEDAISEVGSLQALVEVIGLVDEEELYTLALGGWLEADRNDDRYICVKGFPDTPGTFEYLWSVIDNDARVRGR